MIVKLIIFFFLLQKSCPPKAKAKVFFSSCSEIQYVSWKNCLGICTDGTPLEVFVSLRKKENPECDHNILLFSHQKSARIKYSWRWNDKSLDDDSKMVSFSKQKLFHLRIF